ncbi:MAG: type I DNA topoisomerase [Cardiobacteriaceae bacterium]|nr:type I DNA topoisomerase [Cardiobacteriaceae bacterium]
MSKNLLIVESPAKAKTLHKYLGADFTVLASYGHVRDLVQKNGSVDVDNDFFMHYETIARNAKHVQAIASAAKKAETLYLATDPDREGEAISWHLLELLKEQGVLAGKALHRVVFHEITKTAIVQAIQNPRSLSMDLVNAQQARRALDFLVGFNLSPLLWRKVGAGLSAGRVQSPALRMIVEREREIEAFKTEEYWKITAQLQVNKALFPAQLTVYQGKKLKPFDFHEGEQVKQAIAQLKAQAGSALYVLSVQAKKKHRQPAAPFITSTLQQEAARKLRFSAQRTMRVAQSLYEAGHITYMRTDSVHLAKEAVEAIRDLIEQQYGKVYLPKVARVFTTKAKNAQEAHEAIRPTDVSVAVEQLRHLDGDEQKLYDLIRKRAIASQMEAAELEQVTVELGAPSEQDQFRATGSTIKFAGFMSLYLEEDDDAQEEESALLPSLQVGDKVALNDILGSQHFTQAPPRYSEASLIKALEEHGIGRPSTYASILSTLQNREYVELEQRRFMPTTIGRVVNDFLTTHFERYVNYDFTAKLEDTLDEVSRGEEDWKPVLRHFWKDLSHNIEQKQDISREEVMQARELGHDPATGKPVSVRFGRFGAFAQIGSKDDEEKPQFASLPKGMRMEAITLEQALSLFQLPRILGQTDEGEEVSTNHGRFGPYIRYGKKYVSLPKEESPFTVSLELALQLIEEKKEEERNRFIQTLEHEGQSLQVLNGRFGPYVTDGQINASIPKALNPATLSVQEALVLLEKARARKRLKVSKKTESALKKEESTKKTAKSSKKKPAAKKTTAEAKSGKKTSAKKAVAKKTTTKKAATKKTGASQKVSAETDVGVKKTRTRKVTKTAESALENA